ncbi:MAG: cbb3-type cytochrome c oxidase subunit I [Bacteriovoracaceae bacterium]
MSELNWKQVYKENPPRDSEFSTDELRARLTKTWDTQKGLLGWMMSTDHKTVGKRYIVTALAHLVLAGILAMLMRLQLAFPDLNLMGPDLYNQVFTMHGTVMMFLFAVPMVEGLMIYLVPLMIGTRSIAFPRLNAFSYWVYLVAGFFIWIGFFVNSGPDAGWFAYPPLSGPEYGAGKRVDIYAQMITFTELAGLAVAVEIVVTILKQRAPGMTLWKMPVFVWASLVTSIMIIWSMPAIVTTSSYLLLDRLIGTHFFNHAEGGDPLLWQHLFWYFAHPEVYIIFLPSVGLASHVVETFCRRKMFGYPAIVLSLIAQGFLSFGLWVHHMFATNLPRVGSSFFAASSISIAIPSGTFLFCWLATFATGKIKMALPMLWVVAFFILFLFGGLSGVMLGSVPLNLQLTDTYFIPGHIHFVLIGGALAPLLAAAWFWFPKITGRMLDEKLGMIQWAMFLIGTLTAFLSMLGLGISGMTRRVYTYPHSANWDILNLTASLGAWTLGLSFVLFVVNIWKTMRKNPDALSNPWSAPGLEWSVTSPPPSYNFDLIPAVSGRTPMWEHPEGPDTVTGLRVDEREVLVTSIIEGEPEMLEHVPDPTLKPFYAAMVTSIVLISSIYTPWAIAWGAIPCAIVFVYWLYPNKYLAPKESHEPA